MIRWSSTRRSAGQRFVPPFLVLLSLALILLGKADGVVVGALRQEAASLLAPALAFFSRPIDGAAALAQGAEDWVAVHRRNETLLRENRRLLAWHQAALSLAAENAQLRGLLKLVPKHALSYVSARVIADSGGAYAQSVLIDAGSAEGVERGEAVLGEGGLAGRIAEVGRHVARVLLITDLNSRVPVLLEGKDPLRAILAGDNSPRPRLRFFPAKAPIQHGERVVTSGVGGLFPPNLPVGVVSGFDGPRPLVSPYVRFSQASFLRVVDYGLQRELPTPIAMAGHEGRQRMRAGLVSAER